jgi:hypothetical protein
MNHQNPSPAVDAEAAVDLLAGIVSLLAQFGWRYAGTSRDAAGGRFVVGPLWPSPVTIGQAFDITISRLLNDSAALQ